MKHAVRWVVLLMVVGLAAAPAGAAELRLTGFIDNVFPNFRSNTSQADGDFTRNEDQTTFGRTRGRMYFNAIASDNLRGVFGFEIDGFWGQNPEGSRRSTGTPTRSISRPSGCTSISACRRCRSAIARAWAPCRFRSRRYMARSSSTAIPRGGTRC